MFRTLTFGDLDSRVWGAIGDLGDGLPGFALLGGGSAGSVSVTGSTHEDGWTVEGEGIELEASPEGEAGELDGGFEQLTRVRGHWTSNGSEESLDCLGRRGAREAIDRSRFEALRDVSAWFAPDLGMALVAARPRGSSGHADDVVSACVLEEGHALRVAEPRLSTTYSTSGSPARASFELWLEHPEDEPEAEHGEEAPHRFPRRAAGEAIGAGAASSAGSLDVQAELFRWHARGREGTGIYVLTRLPSA
jgi:hypothetical protein